MAALVGACTATTSCITPSTSVHPQAPSTERTACGADDELCVLFRNETMGRPFDLSLWVDDSLVFSGILNNSQHEHFVYSGKPGRTTQEVGFDLRFDGIEGRYQVRGRRKIDLTKSKNLRLTWVLYDPHTSPERRLAIRLVEELNSAPGQP
jgi:hypothetical protein